MRFNQVSNSKKRERTLHDWHVFYMVSFIDCLKSFYGVQFWRERWRSSLQQNQNSNRKHHLSSTRQLASMVMKNWSISSRVKSMSNIDHSLFQEENKHHSTEQQRALRFDSPTKSIFVLCTKRHLRSMYVYRNHANLLLHEITAYVG